MRHILAFLGVILLATPLYAWADSFPVFPMSLWGAVTINGVAAPTGSVIRAYYGTTLAGAITTQEPGVYGYTDSTKQKLVIEAGSNAVSFTIQAPGFNGGSETGGTSQPTYPQFTSGITANDDITFTIPTPAVSSGGGGGGGGGGGVILGPIVGSSTLPASPTTLRAPQITATSSGQALPAVAPTYRFIKTLQQGLRGNDVMQLQQRLIADGFLTASATGYFGPATAAAVKKYQKAHKLPSTGFVGSMTLASLNSGNTVQPVLSGTLSETERQNLIKKLQAQLAVLLAELQALTTKK